MKKYVSFVMIVFTIAVMMLVTGYAFFDTRTVSESEQRELAKKPELSFESWFDRSYQGKLETFVGEHVWKRDFFISVAQKLENSLQLPGKSLILKDITGEDTKQNNDSEVVVLEDRIVPLYNHNDDSLIYFFETDDMLLSSVPQGINKFFMIPPGRIEYEEEEVKGFSGSAREDASVVYENIDESVTCVPVFDALEQGVAERGINELFYRTDHHWSQLGAYYAATEFLKAAGKPMIDLTDYERRQGYDFQGYLSVKHNIYGMPNDSLYYYVPKDGIVGATKVYWKEEGTGNIVLKKGKAIDPERGGYYTFVDKSQFAYAVIDGRKTDGSSLLMVSDSYGLALSVWLMEEYDTVVIVDPRYYEGVEMSFLQLFDKYEVTDFLLCLQAEEMRVDLFNIKMTKNLLGID